MEVYADVVNNPTFPDTELAGVKQRILAAIDGQNGGIPIRGLQVIQPSCWRFLLLTGQLEAFHESAAANQV